jgi:hypothetical protein
VEANRDADGASSNISTLRDKTGEEVFIAAFGLTVVHWNTNHLLASTPSAIPGTVLGCKCIAKIFFWEGSR